jgi:signal transduction histidine kinase
MSTHELSTARPSLRWLGARAVRSPTARFAGRVLALAVAYYVAAKVGQTLRYTASVAAIWPPAGLGIAALYLFGLRWWPGILLGEILVNAELMLDATDLPLGALLGQQAGNMAEIVLGAVILQRLVGSRAALDRVSQIAGMLGALVVATAISASVGMLSMFAAGVIDSSDMPTFWRTWWLGDTAGGLVMLPLMLAWARDPGAAWRRIRTWEGALLVISVAALGVLAASTEEPATYVVFPGLIWAAFRFGPPGATLSVAISTCLMIGLTANELGPWAKQPIDHRTLSTQLFIVVTALTTLFVAAVVSERERAATELAEAKRHEGEQAMAERHRIARDMHDSVAQALFSTVLQTRAAQKRLEPEGVSPAGPLAQALTAIADLTRGAQSEIRGLIFELGRDPVEDGLVTALVRHAEGVAASDGLRIDIEVPSTCPALSRLAETHIFAIGREALANVVKHADASAVSVRVATSGERVVLEIRDDGRGFDPAAAPAGHFGLDSMHSRAAEIGARLTIASAPGQGTSVIVDAPAAAAA